jgi:outer membrane immunogenic protein
MQRVLFGIAIASILTTSAMAVPAVPAVPPVIYEWTGYYLGANVGYSWGRSNDQSVLTNGYGTYLDTYSSKASLDGVIGGGQAGYNWQSKNWVFGLEADIDASNEKGSRSFDCPTGVCSPATFLPRMGNFNFIANFPLFAIPGPDVPVSMNQKIDWFGTVRGRIGFLVTPQVLLYGTGGLAFGGINTTEQIGDFPFSFFNTDTRIGWTAGAGIEGMIAPHWTAKLEYLYIDLGTTSGSFMPVLPAFGGGYLTSSYSSHVTDNVLRVGVNYQFGGPK